MKGQVVVVTGGNSGIGRATAHQLAHQGARVIIACRSSERAQDAIRDITAKLLVGGGTGTVESMYLDLLKLDSIKSFAEEFYKKNIPLHILINNAGITLDNKKLSKDGFNQVWQTNFLGHFYLIYLLLPKLQEQHTSRIINVASWVHHLLPYTPNWDKEATKASRMGGMSYCVSKYALILLTYELQKRLPPHVLALAVNPGTVDTNIQKPWVVDVMIKLLGLRPDKGCATSVYGAIKATYEEAKFRYITPFYPALACLPSPLRGVTEAWGYFIGATAVCTARSTYDWAQASRLWKSSCELLQIEDFLNVVHTHPSRRYRPAE